MTWDFISLFSGIGGIDLGLERAGMRCVAQVEKDPWCRGVLTKHWPGVPKFGDVLDVGAHNLPRADLVAGGFPCQPVSQAGQRRAQADPRWLWPQFARVVRELRPGYVFVENVSGLLRRGMGDVLGDLAALGYDAEWDSIPAAAVGAPHLRDRVFIVAYANGERPVHGEAQRLAAEARKPALGHARAGRGAGALRRSPRVLSALSDPDSGRLEASTERDGGARPRLHLQCRLDADGCACPGAWPSEPDVARVVDGLPGGVDRVRALGNAVVPWVAEWIGRRIVEAEQAA